ncbi:hypothetical protein NC651_028309 [Populus alba x Populus x berolinensis]|nr:hypothetical protein NC651_028309 [Populus alba x Populus x berolinensis]
MNGDGSGIILLRLRCLATMQWRSECQLFQTTSETENQFFNAQQVYTSCGFDFVQRINNFWAAGRHAGEAITLMI